MSAANFSRWRISARVTAGSLRLTTMRPRSIRSERAAASLAGVSAARTREMRVSRSESRKARASDEIARRYSSWPSGPLTNRNTRCTRPSSGRPKSMPARERPTTSVSRAGTSRTQWGAAQPGPSCVLSAASRACTAAERSSCWLAPRSSARAALATSCSKARRLSLPLSRTICAGLISGAKSYQTTVLVSRLGSEADAAGGWALLTGPPSWQSSRQA
ncbi:MAG: hypothetical protein HPKKFMNG_02061 [Planctomycetes bacterium]|nr:hypothetical protein [Planctomycetota bacterium]